MNAYYYYPRGYQDARVGPLLPFLAGVLVTTPFLFLNNKNNQPAYVYPSAPYYYPQPMPMAPYGYY